MTITYRNSGPWGSGKGAPLTILEADTNIWDLESQIAALTGSGGGAPTGGLIVATSVTGSVLTFTYDDGTTQSFTLPSYQIPEVTNQTVASLTVLASMQNQVHMAKNAGGLVVNVTSNSLQPIGINAEFHFRQCAAGGITFVEAASGVLINDGVTEFLNETNSLGAVVTLKKVASEEWVLWGHLRRA